MMFDAWLTAIHGKYENEQLNHFEHNIEVWRELWRVTERATHVRLMLSDRNRKAGRRVDQPSLALLRISTQIVVVTDIRNPLLHIPPSIYDFVTAELKKPMTVVLNKVDLVPSGVVELWKTYLARRFPLCKFVCFSSRSKAVQGDTDVSTRRRVLRFVVGFSFASCTAICNLVSALPSRSASLTPRCVMCSSTRSKKLEVGDVSAIRGAVDILKSCEIDAEIAQSIAEELNTTCSPDTELLEDEVATIELERQQGDAKGKRRAKRKQKPSAPKPSAPSQVRKDANGFDVHPCSHCGYNDAVIACLSCASTAAGQTPVAATEAEAIARGYLLCARCDEEEHETLKNHRKVRLQAAVVAEATPPAEVHSANIPKVTIGLIGHPNVGKSSVLNALAGKKIVSVSHTPGHTKRLQTIMIHPDICICDCPGLVFPFADVPKYLQELCGLYPFSQVRACSAARSSIWELVCSWTWVLMEAFGYYYRFASRTRRFGSWQRTSRSTKCST